MKWWQRLAGILIRGAKTWLDESQPVEGLCRFLEQRLQALSMNNASTGLEFAYACQLAAEVELFPRDEAGTAVQPNLPTIEQVEQWRQALPRERVITRNGLIPGAGLMLLSILDLPGIDPTFLQTELERLLRRVEVKRQAALELARPTDPSTSWMEKHAVAILFSRAARHFQDLRFLNAALKLNDWAFASHRRSRSGPLLERYLWSLAEQETSWEALIG